MTGSAAQDAGGGGAPRPMSREERRVILASSLGTVFEWYDFYLYGALATIIAQQFFAGLDATSAFLFALLAFAAGFIVRPFGALVFGRLGDMIGRKYTFLVTILIMGLATFMVGVLPNYASIGVAAPVILIGLRLLQGLALGGEYGGAATYVAEHAPAGRRGAYTAWIQTTATTGLFLSLLVILGTRTALGEAAFNDWGWRLPFLLSIVLLAVSVWIRLKLAESPAFQRMKARGRTSRAPVAEAFGRWQNLKMVLIALLGLTAGQAVVWYTGQFYALFFLTQQLKVDAVTANVLMALALCLGTPFFLIFGALSDKVGRKPLIMLGCALAVATYFPAFQWLAQAANPDLVLAQERNRVVVWADPAQCSFQFNPTGAARFTSSCDIAKQVLAAHSVSYDNEAAPPGSTAEVRIGSHRIASFNAQAVAAEQLWAREAAFRQTVADTLAQAGYPTEANPQKINKPLIVLILAYLVLLVTMVYGPIAAMLAELFPTRIRYTSMSLPYHIGNGWFGGLLPTMSFAIVAQTGNMYNGLWYPIGVAAMTLLLGMALLPETKNVDMYARD